MVDLLLALWLLALTGYLGWQRYRVTRAVTDRRQRIDALRARRVTLEQFLERMQSPDAATRVEAARALIRHRAASR